MGLSGPTGTIGDDSAKPATSSYLNYSLPPLLDHCSSWNLECTVVVHQVNLF